MKKFFFGLLFLSSLAQADVNTFFVKNFNFEYVNPHGTGSAQAFGLGSSSGSALRITIDRLDRDFKLIVSGTEEVEYELKNAPDLFVDANSIGISELGLSFNEKLTLSLRSGIFESRKDGIKIDGLMIDSNRELSDKDSLDQLLQGATQRLSLKLSKFTSTDRLIFTEDILGASEKGGEFVVNTLDLKINGRKFDLSADVRAQVSGKVKATGQIIYDSSIGQLTIKIVEVKFGFLNITSKVFDELKKNESPRLKVNEPYVYYQLK